MVDVMLIKQELREDIAKGRYADGMQKLRSWMVDSGDKTTELIHLVGRFEVHAREKRMELYGRVDVETQENRIINSFLELVNRLENRDISEEAIFRQGIHERILVVSNTEEGTREMEKFFRPLYFSKVAYDTSNKVLSGDILSGFDLLLFNYMYRNLKDGKYYRLLEDYLKSSEIPMLYFGTTQLDVMHDERYFHRLYTANYVFSLYARIREMIEYRRLHRGEASTK